jgi:hypothetical protein
VGTLTKMDGQITRFHIKVGIFLPIIGNKFSIVTVMDTGIIMALTVVILGMTLTHN